MIKNRFFDKVFIPANAPAALPIIVANLRLKLTTAIVLN